MKVKILKKSQNFQKKTRSWCFSRFWEKVEILEQESQNHGIRKLRSWKRSMFWIVNVKILRTESEHLEKESKSWVKSQNLEICSPRSCEKTLRKKVRAHYVSIFSFLSSFSNYEIWMNQFPLRWTRGKQVYPFFFVFLRAFLSSLLSSVDDLVRSLTGITSSSLFPLGVNYYPRILQVSANTARIQKYFG